MGQSGARLDQRLYRRLPAEQAAAVCCTVSRAERRALPLYLVGGGVRDLLLGAAYVDIDLVVEGDAIALARAVAKELRARAVAHARFGTAVVRHDDFRLDLAQARAERYDRPGALPSVQAASIADDLARRDLTINAMALRLTGPGAGALLDPFCGQDDLVRRRVRVLHDDSFRDDATRVLRALRYAGRLGFRIEAHTAHLLQRDLSYLTTISGARLQHEFERIAEEDRVGRIVRLADKTGVLRALHPALTSGERALRASDRLHSVPAARRSAVLFALLLTDATPSTAGAAIDRLALTGEQERAVRGLLALRRSETRLARATLRVSDAVRLLEPHPPAAIEAFALLTGRTIAARRARRYLEDWRSIRPRLDGRDVVALGVPRGPQVGTALAALRDARLDGRVTTRKDEETLAREGFVRGRPRPRKRHG